MATIPEHYLRDLHLISKMITQVMYGKPRVGLPSVEVARSIVKDLLGIPQVLKSDPELENIPSYAMTLFDEVMLMPSGRAFLQEYLHNAVNLVRNAINEQREVPAQLLTDVEFMMECVEKFKATFQSS